MNDIPTIPSQSASASPLPRGCAAAGWGLALAAALTLYGLTMAPDLVWHDAGYYQVEAAKLDLVRPGETVRVHPLFVAIGHELGSLGVWNYAKAASVASAIGTAVTVANVWLIVFLLVRRVGPAAVAALACMMAHTIWQLGVQPQTYGWSSAALSGMIATAVAYVQGGRVRWLLVMFFVGGLGLSVHLMSQLGLVVLGGWVLVRVVRGRTPAWVIPAGLGCWIAGAALFWYVVGLEYQRTHDVLATAQSALLGGWGEAVFNVAGVPRMMLRSLLMLGLNFPTPVVLLGAYGLWRSRSVLAGTPLALLLGLTAALYVLFASRYAVPNQNFFFTPVYMLVAVYIGLGVYAAGEWRRKRKDVPQASGAQQSTVIPSERSEPTLPAEAGYVARAGGSRNLAVGNEAAPVARRGPSTSLGVTAKKEVPAYGGGNGVLLAAAIVLTLAMAPTYWLAATVARAAGVNLRESGAMHDIPYRDIYAYYLQPWQQTQVGPRRFAEEVLAELPPRAVLLPDTTTSPPLKYVHDIEGRRPDVLIVDSYDVRFNPPLGLFWASEGDPRNVLAPGRRVFVLSTQPGYFPGWISARADLVPLGPNEPEHFVYEVKPRQATVQP